MTAPDERLRRWRLVLGGDEADGTGIDLAGADRAIDAALRALYEPDRKGGLGGSAPAVTRWLGDIRRYFPAPVVRVLQRDALERLDLKRMLLEPELLEATVPDVHLVATLLSLASVMPERTRETARRVVADVVADLERRLLGPIRQAVTGSLARATRGRRPRHHHEIDWHRTIRANLRHWEPRRRALVPATRIGYGRRRSGLRDVILCVDQSGSMAASVVYAGVCAASLASLPALSTQLLVFDTQVADLTPALADPVEVLFGAQLGGGTDLDAALAACATRVQRPADTVLVLVSDLFDGGDRERTIRRAAALVRAGVQLVVLLALSDEGAPAYDHTMAAELAALGAPVFACTPDRFPAMMAAALAREDVGAWAAAQGIVTARADDAEWAPT